MSHGKLHYITLQCTPSRSSPAHLCNFAHSVSPAICLTCDRSTSSPPRAMAGSNRIAAAALVSIGVLVVMAMVAESSAAGVCNPNALYPCLSAIQGARPPWPSRQCCNVVKSVDKNCMCNQLKSSSFPAQMLNNGLQLPKKCGRTDLRGFRCGRYTFPF